MNRLFHQLLTVSTFALLIISGWAVGPANADDAPIHIAADHMSSTEKSNSVIFTGDVDAKQGDVRILSDEMTVFYSPKAKSEDGAQATQQVEKLICVGNVEITRGEWLGTSKKMIYLSKERQIVLMDNAKAWQGQNMVSGDKIIYYLDEGRSEIVAGPGSRPEGTFGDAGGEEKPSRVKMTIMQQ